MYAFQKEKKYQCWACDHPIDTTVKVSRKDECISCGADLHVCMNCRFHDPGSHNECRDNVTAYIRSREKANFCMAFELKNIDKEDATEANDARAKLEAMFKNLK